MPTYGKAYVVVGSLAISSSASSDAGWATSPEDGFMILNIHTTAAVTVMVDGKTVLNAGVRLNEPVQIYVGPEQELSFSGNTGTISATGVKFQNA